MTSRPSARRSTAPPSGRCWLSYESHDPELRINHDAVPYLVQKETCAIHVSEEENVPTLLLHMTPQEWDSEDPPITEVMLLGSRTISMKVVEKLIERWPHQTLHELPGVYQHVYCTGKYQFPLQREYEYFPDCSGKKKKTWTVLDGRETGFGRVSACTPMFSASVVGSRVPDSERALQGRPGQG